MTRTRSKGIMNINQTEYNLARKNSITGSASANPSTMTVVNNNGGSPKSPHGVLDPSIDDSVPCRGCDKIIGRGEVLQCDRCNSWLHFRCAKITREEFDFLTSHPQTSVMWNCDHCKTELVWGPGGQDDRVARQGAKIDTLTEAFKAMQAQMAFMQNQMTVLIDLVKDKENNKTEVVKSDQQIRTHVTEYLDDQREKDEKKNNMIMFNVAESDDLDEKVAHETDVERVKEVLAVVHPNVDELELSVKNVIRLGRNKHPIKNRPVKVILKDNRDKGIIFANSWKLRNCEEFQKVGITSDKTKKEMERFKELKFQLQTKKEETGEDDWIIFKDEIIKKSDKPARNVPGRQTPVA